MIFFKLIVQYGQLCWQALYHLEEDDSLASTSLKEDPFNWSPKIITEQAVAMFKLKEIICDKATANIKKFQEKDQFYYKKKHPDLRVCKILTTIQ